MPFNFEDKNIKFLNSLHEDYDYFNITFRRLDYRYDKDYISRNIAIEAYFRFSVSDLLAQVKKVLYLILMLLYIQIYIIFIFSILMVKQY